MSKVTARARLSEVVGQVGARDVFLFLGLALLCSGAGMVYLPAAPIIAGLAFLFIGFFGVPSWR
jgi:hypothetical protein